MKCFQFLLVCLTNNFSKKSDALHPQVFHMVTFKTSMRKLVIWLQLMQNKLSITARVICAVIDSLFCICCNQITRFLILVLKVIIWKTWRWKVKFRQSNRENAKPASSNRKGKQRSANMPNAKKWRKHSATCRVFPYISLAL